MRRYWRARNLARKYAKEHNITSGVVYIEKMRQTRDEQVLIATRFHAAIQRGEFEMFLQPKFRLKREYDLWGRGTCKMAFRRGRILTAKPLCAGTGIDGIYQRP